MKQKSVTAVTLGCKLNYAETSAILDMLLQEGWQLAEPGDRADLFIVHTCAVTGQAEQKSRQQIRKIIRKNPGSRIAVIGCYAQLDPGRVAGIDGVSLVLGTTDKFELAHYTGEAGSPGLAPLVVVSPVRDLDVALPGSSMLCRPDKGRTRAFLKIQDGCSHGCSYCTIPNIRGRSRSVPLDVVLERAAGIAGAGYREIVLTGVNIADYRDGQTRFPDLLRRLEQVDVSRIRIGSVEPDLLDLDLIGTVAASGKIMPHFHLPLQSGSDRILKSMGRHYDTATYRKRFIQAVEAIPGCGIGADVMTGYPGEGAQEFDEMYRFLESLPTAYLHVFTCSVRPGTTLSRQVARRELRTVPHAEAASRASRLAGLARRLEQNFASLSVGRSLRVLFEEGVGNPDGTVRWSGYSENYLRVDVDLDPDATPDAMRGSVHEVLVDGVGEDLHLTGRLLS
ncbi:MAG: MiaB/RimO family radical SAM methylthiotransferase [Chlorobiaceae bacterium]|nr:MiaB/RimO family radical SAM methylthiotransferase [Chlorobiaceae bacterium]NTW73997.1 MiaB/RimO family radical SAM methylthiotransferase [Chlorobiaceae bacterium]